jgi:F-type H+-transporting ATPase subunit b
MLNFSVTFFFTLVNLAVLFFVLRALLFKPVTKFMADRTAAVRSVQDQAERDRAEATALLASARESLDTARSNAAVEAKRIVAQARDEAAAITEGARQDAKAIKQAAKADVEGERRAAYTAFRVEAAGLVLAATARLLRLQVGVTDAGVNQSAAETVLSELEARL